MAMNDPAYNATSNAPPGNNMPPTIWPRPEDVPNRPGVFDPTSPLTPDETRVGGAGFNQLPGFLSFDRVFEAQYPDAPPLLRSVAADLVRNLGALYGTPGKPGLWHPMAAGYTYDQFLRDVAVAATARGEVAEQGAKSPEPRPQAQAAAQQIQRKQV